MKAAGCLMLAGLLAGSLASPAQERAAKIGFVFPAGGERGSSFQAVVGGQHLQGAMAVVVSRPGVEATVTGYRRPLPQQRYTEFSEALREAKVGAGQNQGQTTEKAGKDRDNRALIAGVLEEVGATPEEIEAFFLLREQKQNPRKQPNAQLEELVTLDLRIAPDAEPGPCTFRILTPRGISPPLAFTVGTHREIREEDAKEPLNFPVVVNGQILPGECDRFAFRAAKGQKLVFSVQARDLIPYLADAVPGWFQPSLEIRDASGNPVAHAGAFRFRPDPVILFEVPQAGEYSVELRDSLYRGREDFVYRLTAGEIPFVTGHYPMGGPVGKPTRVGLTGWNLPAGEITLQPQKSGVLQLPGIANNFSTNDRAFHAATVPRVHAVEPDDKPGQAPLVSFPTAIDGRMDRPGDTDVFAVQCRKGESLVFEVMARRLHSPVDAFLEILDAKGKTLASNDDSPETETPFLTQHADPKLTFTPESDGIHYIRITDAQQKGGGEFSYILEIRPPQPGFAARVVPSAVNAPAGTSVPLDVHVSRKDGFDGEVEVLLDGEFGGATLSGAVVPAGCNSVRITLDLPASLPPGPLNLAMLARARDLENGDLQAVQPCDDVLQAFFYNHLVPSQDFVARVTPGSPKFPRVRLASDAPVVLEAGKSRPIEFSVESHGSQARSVPVLELDSPPEGIRMEKMETGANGPVIFLAVDSGKLAPGTRGNLIVRTSFEKANANGKKFRNAAGCLPTIPFVVGSKENGQSPASSRPDIPSTAGVDPI